MNQVRKWNIIGGRVIKTGIAVFLTVLVCEFLIFQLYLLLSPQL